MDMSSLANVRSITNSPGNVTTYDERGNRVLTNATIKNANGTPSVAYSAIAGKSPYSSKNTYEKAMERWWKARMNGTTSDYGVGLVRDLLRRSGYSVDGLSGDQIMALYTDEIAKGSFDMNYLNGRVTGRASSGDHTLYGKGASPESMALNPNVSSSVTRHFDAAGRRIALR